MSKREQDSTNTTNVSLSQLREQQVVINKALDETRDNIKKAANEAKKDISTYAEQFTTVQERAIESARDIAEEYIESQREIFNSFYQLVWTPYVENVVNRTTTPFPGVFSLPRTEVYANTSRIVLVYTSSVVDNFVTTTRLANKTVFTNAELINTSFQQARNNVREYSKIGVNTAKNFHEAANEVAKIGFSAVESTTVSTQRRQ
jgi:lipid II:glycine glycyltransferase (peptidoglycan interpeptide bridge formation enzyme)